MTTYNRYQKLQKYIDNVPQNEYKQGELIGEVEYETLEECEGRLQYRWVISETKTICTGYDLYSLEVRQISKDGGITWKDTDETRTGPLIEKWSKQCGVVTQYRWQTTGVNKCEGMHLAAQSIYQKSEDMGNTWENVIPIQYKYDVTDIFSDECVMQSKPLTFQINVPDDEQGHYLEEVSLTSSNRLAITLRHISHDCEPSYSSYGELRGYWNYWYTQYYDCAYVLVDYDDDVEGTWEYNTEELKTNLMASISGSYCDSKLPVFITEPYKIDTSTFTVTIPRHLYSTPGVKTIRIWGYPTDVNFGDNIVTILDYGDQNPTPQDRSFSGAYKGMEVFHIASAYKPWKIVDYSNNVEIGDYKDYFTELTTFKLSDSPTTLHGEIIAENFTLTNCPNVTIPWEIKSNVVNIENCDSINSLALSNNERCTIQDCDGLTTIEGITDTLNIINCPNVEDLSGVTVNTDLSLTNIEGLKYPPTVTEAVLSIDGCLNLENLNLGGKVTVSQKLNYLPNVKSITGNWTVDTDGAFEGMTSLTDISQMTVNTRSNLFKDCINIPEMPALVRLTTDSDYMFENTAITSVDLSKFESVNKCQFISPFKGCDITEVTNSFPDLVKGTEISGMFYGMPNLKSVPAVFKNQTTAIVFDGMFANCNITSIDNEFFKYYFTDGVFPTIAVFAENPNLSTYPVQYGLPMWKWPAFYDGVITYTGNFYNTKISDPEGWVNICKVDYDLEITKIFFSTHSPSVEDSYLEGFNYFSPEGKRYSSAYLLRNPLCYTTRDTLDIRISDDGYANRPNVSISKIYDWGLTTDTRCHMGRSSTLTTVPLGKKLYKDLTSFIGYQKLPNSITHLPEGFFDNAVVLSEASYLGWSLDEESWLNAIRSMPALTTLTYANTCKTRPNSNAVDVYNRYTTFDISNSPNIENLEHAFYNSNITSIKDFNPSKVTNLKETFYGNAVTEIDNSFNNMIQVTSAGRVLDENPITTIKNSFNGWSHDHYSAVSIVNSYNDVLDTSGEYVENGIVNSYNNSKATSTSIKSGVELIRDSFNNISTFPTIPTSVKRVDGRCFENIPVTSVASKFANNTNLQVIPSDLFSTSKDITNFNSCFSGCSNLTGSSPVDENGYKLWERAGKEGYPTSISGTNCFAKCYKLDDFINIPEAWGGNGGSNLIFKLHTDSSYITINDFDYYNTTPKPIYIDNMTSYDFYSSTTSSSQTNTISWFPDTKNVTTFTPFPSYYTINYIDLDASSTTSLAGLFYNTKSVGSIKVRNTQNVTDFSKSLCHISDLDMSTVNLNKGENFNYAFYYSTLKNAENLSLPRATDVTYAFNYSTITGDTLNLSIPLATSLYYTFNNAKVKNINLQATGNITNLSYAFYYSTLENITGLDYSNVTNMDYAFGYSDVVNIDIEAPLLTSAKYTFRDCKSLKNFRFICPSLTTVDSYFLYNITAFDRVEVDLTSYTGTISYLAKNAPYMLFRNIGLRSSYGLSYSSWGSGSEENRQSILDTLITYSQDRSDNPCTVTLSTFTKSQISIEEMAQINAKGYTIA